MAGLCALLVLAIIAWAYQFSSGAGPASRRSSPTAGTITEAYDASARGPWTFGFQLCLTHGGRPAVITRVRPSRTVGQGFRYLGALAWSFTSQPNGASPAHVRGPVGNAQGFPPKAPGRLFPAVGYRVSASCSNPASDGVYTELLLGLTQAGTRGGGWLGVEVSYRVGQRRRAAMLAYDLFACGPAVARYASGDCAH